MKRTEGEKGAALLTVLSVLAVLGVIVALLFDRLRPDLQTGVREARDAQAVYLAESGIAYQLYLERFSDSADPSMEESKDSLAPPGEAMPEFGKAPKDTFRFHLDTSLAKPEVSVDRGRAFLDITAKGAFRGAAATIFARFGKALDDTVFGPALTLDNADPLQPFPQTSIVGPLRLRTAGEGMPSLHWREGFSVTAYAAQFTEKKYLALESALEKKLGDPATQSGAGEFEPGHPPDFSKSKEIAFSLGQVEIKNDGDHLWVIRGPGKIFAEGEIRVKGLIRLENVTLLSGKDVVFEDSVIGEGISVYARRSVFFHNRCDMEVEAVAGKDIVLEDHCRTALGSVLLSVGGKNVSKGPDSLNAIRVIHEAVAGGFLIAGGENGRVVVGTSLNRVEGVVMAAQVWLAGTVYGPVLARKLLCEGTNTKNCLGDGHIDRSRLPQDFVQPLELGSQDRRAYRFKLLQWKRT